MIGAFVIGGVMAVAGLIALVVGTPVKEFSLGNTLLLSGAIFIAGGLMLIGLGLMGRELKQALTGGEASPQPRKLALPPDGGEAGAGPEPSASATAETSPVRPHAGDAAPPPAAAAPPAEPPKPKRNLLFASTSRRERERAERQVDPAFAATAAKPEPSPPPASREARGSAFDEAWPEPERAQGSARRSRPAAEPVAAPSPPPPPPSPPAPTEEPAAPQVTVLKEGVVDGMAYKLFSDGSMEAQLPEGTMRFASLDELRNYLEQRG